MLPSAFCARMERLLGKDYPAFLAEMQKEPCRAFRVNTVKCDLADFAALSPPEAEKIPYTVDGFYHHEEKIGALPIHHAGAIYSQDPGAMSAVCAMPLSRGMRVLDVCAAPGGKSAQLYAAIGDEGLLVANEYVPARCKLLVGNIERLGIKNALVLHEDSRTLASWYPAFFDAVLVDAPCSGEGMFRKNEEAQAEWSEENVTRCAARQKEILACAAVTVAPGGYLLYSTCTFSPEENEGVVAAFLESHADFSLCPVPAVLSAHTAPGLSYAGRDLSVTRRFYPHIAPGEGQYMALLQRAPDGVRAERPAYRDTAERPNKADMPALRAFFSAAWGDEKAADAVRLLRGNLILPPPLALPPHSVFAAGVLVGEVRKGNLFPHHQLFSAYGDRFLRRLTLVPEDTRLSAYLRGEEIDAPDTAPGYAAISLGPCPIGGAKISNGRAKNLYPKGLRSHAP